MRRRCWGRNLRHTDVRRRPPVARIAPSATRVYFRPSRFREPGHQNVPLDPYSPPCTHCNRRVVASSIPPLPPLIRAFSLESSVPSPLRCAVDSPGPGGRKPYPASDSGGSPRATLDQRSPGAYAEPPSTAQPRSDLKPARTSSEKSSGCSQAA